MLGTVGYMSPEQASGQPVDFRSDQFALGAILYEMVAGRRAFERPTAVQTLSAIIQDEPEPLAAAAPKTADEPRLDRRALPRQGSRGSLRLDQRPGARSRRAARPCLRRSRSSGSSLRRASGGFGRPGALPPRRFGRRRPRRSDVLRGPDAPGAPRPRGAAAADARLLTFRRGFLTGARFAPDGQTIVYSAAWDGKPSEIFTTRVGSAIAAARDLSGAWILAISSAGEMAISLGCDRRGKPCRERSPVCRSRAALRAKSSTTSAPPTGRRTARSSRCLSSDASSTRSERCSIRRNPNGFVSSVRVSPDGALVAFLDHPRLDSERAILSVVDRAGQKRAASTEWAALGPILWSPTGEEVFFAPMGRREIRGMTLASANPPSPVDSRPGRRLARGTVSRHRDARRQLPQRHPGPRAEGP